MSPRDGQRDDVIAWLLDGDPSIRWQVMRDLIGAGKSQWQTEQRRVGREGWGAELLAHRDRSGRWTPRLYGQKWISTTYTLVLLRRLGLPGDDARAIESSRLFLDDALGSDNGIDVSSRRTGSETCITAMVVALLYWFEVEDPRRRLVLAALLDRQLPDGGWNCVPTSRHGSFHTTISALEALREAAIAGAPGPELIETAEARGREFFLRHHLHRSHRTGDPVSQQFLRFSFPPRWHFDVLRGLDYFYSARAMTDERLDDAISIVSGKQRTDGRWVLQQRWPGATWFEMEEVGEPSRWNTLRAMRVLEAGSARP